MTISEWPASSRRRSERISLAMSSKCRPVVGSSNRNSVPFFAAGLLRALRGLGEEAGQLQALRLAARQRRHRLAQLHVVEADVDDRLQPADHLAVVGEQLHGFADGQLQHVGDRQLAVAPHQVRVQHLGAEALAVAIGAAQVDVGQELHLDVLEARAAAGRAAAVAGVEREHAGAVVALDARPASVANSLRISSNAPT